MSQSLRRLLLALAVALDLIALAALAYFLLPRPPAPDPLAEYRPALAPDFALDAAQLAALQQYSISVRIDPENQVYTGTMDVSFPVTGTAPLEELYFRLYPNLPQFDGRLEVNTARVNGISVSYSYTSERTAAHLTLPRRLPIDSRVDVQLTFQGEWNRHVDNYYTIFGQSEGIHSLTNFYPIVAKQRSNGWATEQANPQGDVGFQDAALYKVSVSMPAGQVVVATGTAITDTQGADGWRNIRYVEGPAREFTLLFSPDFQVEETDAYGTQVRSYFMADHAVAGRAALVDAVAALQIYSDVFGRYPYREMAVVEAPLTIHGMEFPGINLIGKGTYAQHPQDLEILVAHEVAHQWWYNQVGSDQTQTPWLDEGLAEFSVHYYYARRYGIPAADALWRTRWTNPVKYAVERGMDAPIGRPVDAYQGNYETVVYAKGALFFDALRDEMGPDVFQELLRTYLRQYEWRVATPSDFQSLAERVSGRDLSALFRHWVEGDDGTGSIAPQPLPTASTGTPENTPAPNAKSTGTP